MNTPSFFASNVSNYLQNRRGRRWGGMLATIVLAGIAAVGITIVPGCGNLVDMDVQRAWRSAPAETELTIYPTVVREGKVFRHDAATAQRLADWFETQGLVTPQLSDVELPLNGPGRRNQSAMVRDSLARFQEYVKAHPPETAYVAVVEVLMGKPESEGGRVGGVHYYVLAADGRCAEVHARNSHQKEFARRSPRNPDTAMDVIIAELELAYGLR